MKSPLAYGPALVLVAIGCSGTLSVGKDGTGGSCNVTVQCPTDAPADQTACSLGCNQSTLSCTFDCAHGQGYNTFATCDGQKWSVQRSMTACPAPTSDAGTCGQTAAACPDYAPANQSSCTLGCNQSTLSCTFDCAHGQGYLSFATCDGQKWTVQRSMSACPAPTDASACAATDLSCPTDAPADQTACNLGCNQSTLSCSWNCAHGQGYNTFGSCNGQVWTVFKSLTGCAVDAG